MIYSSALLTEEFAVPVTVHFRYIMFYISTDSSRKPQSILQKHPHRSKVLRAGIEWLVHQRELQRRSQSNTPHIKEVTLPPGEVKHDVNIKVNVDYEPSTTSSVLLFKSVFFCY